MPLILLFLLGCFDTWYTPYVEPITVGPLSLPTVEHALTISSKDLFQTPRTNNTLESWKEKHCSSPNHNPNFPYEHMMPLILSVEIDRIQINGTTLLVDNLTIASSRSRYPSRIIDPLFEDMRSRYDLMKQLLSQCRQLQETTPLTLLIAIDERVSTEWVYNILYTLGQAQFAHLAFLVHDHTPSNTPTTYLVGGIDPSEDWTDEQILDREEFTFTSSVVTLSETDQINWTGPAGDTLQGTINELPRFLEYASPPVVTLEIDNSPYFHSVMQGYNSLYKSGTYCIQMSTSQNKELKNSVPSISALRSDSFVPDTWNQMDKSLSVILVDLPMIGGHPKIYKRTDGVRCAINIYNIEEPIRLGPELVNRELIEQLLKESSKPTENPLFQFK